MSSFLHKQSSAFLMFSSLCFQTGLSLKQHYEGDVEDLCLDFTLTEELGGRRIVHELRPGGKNISVTNENKLHYVHAIADYKLNRQVCYLVCFLVCSKNCCSLSRSSLFDNTIISCRYCLLQMHFTEDSVISFHHLG